MKTDGKKCRARRDFIKRVVLEHDPREAYIIANFSVRQSLIALRSTTLLNFNKPRFPVYRAYDAAARDIEGPKNGFLNQVEQRSGQSVSDEEFFAIRFEIA